MARGIPREPSLKAQYIALVIGGEGRRRAARTLGIPWPTAAVWNRADPRLQPVRPQNDEFDGLVAEFLEEGLVGMRVATAQLRDESWLRKQDGHGFGVAVGVVADKVARILDAYGTYRAGQSGPGGDLDGPAPPADVPGGN